MTLGVAFAAAALVGVNAQAIEAWIASDTWNLWIGAVGAVVALFSLSGVPIQALPGFRGFARTLGRWFRP